MFRGHFPQADRDLLGEILLFFGYIHIAFHRFFDYDIPRKNAPAFNQKENQS